MNRASASELIPLVAQAAAHAGQLALVTTEGRFSYEQLLDASARGASVLLDGRKDLREARVAFLHPPGFGYATTQWAIWRAGGVAVPLAVMHPPAELAYVIEDSQASTVVADPDLRSIVQPLAEKSGLRFVLSSHVTTGPAKSLPQVDPARRAMILYTSGTTSRPKGVVSTHEMIAAQIGSLVEAWEWTANDHILHVLPLHHVHGIINALSCALWCGATCQMLPKFDAREVWQRICRSHELTLFMAVPTIYAKLIAEWETASPEDKKMMSQGCKRLRLMVSGSAALPVSMFEKWQSISGHALLERYGMTEIGMALSNPLRGKRKPGYVGLPLPGVEVRLVGDDGRPPDDGCPGEIQVRGPNVFKEYWRRPEATRAAFTDDGWFRTGDIAVRESGVFRILGRNSVDIIKTGGYKVSALEIEEVLLEHEAVRQCAVVAIEDPEWGERVGAAVVLRPGQDLTLSQLRAWAKRRLAPYKVPSKLITLDELPRNTMGKVTKPKVVELFDR
ncbi:MAG: acyl-CoA synthetase [Pirellulales bacterium]